MIRYLLSHLVKSSHQNKPPVPLQSILESDLLQGKTSSGDPISYPFMNVSFRTNLRVVDFFPSKIEDFTHRLDDQNYSDVSVRPDDSQMQIDGTPYEWMFYLIVEGVEKNPSGERVKMPLLVHGKDAEYLLNLEPTE
jgi:protection of telomeres protein 1